MPIEVHRVDGVVGLVRKALEIAKSLPPARALWFRGLANEAFTLLPRLMRDAKSADEVFEREKRLLTRFRQRSLPLWPQGYPQNDWEHLFAMQHYGVPTRLLDWSENLFFAAHFALANPIDDKSCSPVVWCIDPVDWNRSTPVLSEYGNTIHVLTTVDDEAEAYRPETVKRRGKSPVAIYGTHNSQRIVAQRGTFIVWGNEPKPLEHFANVTSGAKLWKVVIEGDRSNLAGSLSALGFGETMVFPELPFLAQELTRSEGWRV